MTAQKIVNLAGGTLIAMLIVWVAGHILGVL